MLDAYVNAGSQAARYPRSRLEHYVTSSFTVMFELLSRNPNLTRIALQDTRAGERYRERIVGQIAENMRRNQALGIVDESVDPQIAAESVVASVERLVSRYVVSGEKTAEELGRQAARLFLNGILARRGSGTDAEGGERS
ncbi:hypothetical protein [Brevibacillus marinus]|uniref:hypothetical protein n=1 Tax=Brevibacillus marinus TaxID=2496837 RepID=UPI000F82F11C|nr:hypothetical protein [Brevibacillus marinus]